MTKMIIKSLIESLFGLVKSIMSLLPSFPQIELFQNLDTSEFTSVFTSITNVLGYFFPCGTIVTLIGIELLINNYRLLGAVWYRIKHIVLFV